MVEIDATVDTIIIRFEGTKVQGNIDGLERLINTMERLKLATRSTPNLVKLSSQIDRLNVSIKATHAEALSRLVSGLESLKVATSGLSLAPAFNQLSKLPQIFNQLDPAKVDTFANSISRFASSLAPLQGLTRASGLQSFMNQLKKIPEVVKNVATIDTAKLQEFVGIINQLTVAMKPLATEMDKVARGFSALPTRIQKVITSSNKMAASKRNLGGAVSKVTKANNAFNRSTLVTTARTIISLAVIRRAAMALGSIVVKANEYVENINLFNVSMGKFAQEAGKYAKRVQELAGIDMSEFTRNQGIMMSVAKGFGVAEDNAYKMSKALTETAYDAMSLFNATNTDEAFNKFKSGLAGELEPLRQWGYALDQATLKQVALSHGITKSFNTMTQGEKAQIRYMAIMEQSARMGVFNDLARQIDTPANALRILKSQFGVLARTIGQVFIPVLMVIVPYIRAVTTVLIELFSWLSVLAGYKPPEIKDMSSGLVGLSDTADSVADGVGNIGGQAKKSNKAIKDTRKLLAGFDRLNILDDKKSDTLPGVGGGGGGALVDGGMGVDFELPERPDFLAGLDGSNPLVQKIKDTFESLKQSVQPFIDTVSNINWEPMSTALSNVWAKMQPVLSILGETVTWIINNAIAPFIKWLSELYYPVSLDLLASGFELLRPILESAIQTGKDIYTYFLKPIASFVADATIKTLNILSDIFSTIGKWMSNNRPIVDAITMTISTFALAWGILTVATKLWTIASTVTTVATTGLGTAMAFLTSPIGLVVLAIAAVIGTIVLLAKNWETIKQIASNVWEGIKTTWSRVSTWFYTTVILPLQLLFTAIWLRVSSSASTAWKAIVNTFTGALKWFNTTVITPVTNTFSTLWNGVKNFASGAWTGMKNVFAGVQAWFKTNVSDKISGVFSSLWNGVKTTASNAWNGLLGIFTSGGKIFDGIVGSVSSVFKSIVNSLIGGVNTVIATPFNVINSLLNGLRSTNIFGIKPFEKMWSYNPLPVPKIPKLATGTNYVQREGLAMIHEGEAVVPKKYNPALGGNVKDENMTRLLEEQNRLLTEILDKDTVVTLDGEKISKNQDIISKRRAKAQGY